MDTLNSSVGQLREDYFLDARIFTDAQVFQEELEKIFGRAWVFLGHECEAKEVGNFFCFEIGGTPVVIGRGPDSRLRGFIDACHVCEGTVTTGRWGKGEAFRCAEGHAVYDFRGQVVAGDSSGGLKAIELESLYGMVFGALAPDESLREFLGEALLSWWSRIFRPDVEWEMVHVFTFPTAVNWKAFMQPGDGYHGQGLHRLFFKYALPRKSGFYGMQALLSPAYGHVLLSYPPLDYERFRQNVWRSVKSPEEVDIPPLVNVPAGYGGYIGELFPNMFYSIRNGWVFAANSVVPRAPGRMKLDRRAYCRAGLSAAQKQIIQREEDIWSYPMGLNGQDDLANFEWQQKALLGSTLARWLVARYPGEDPESLEMNVQPDSEAGYRTYFRRWQKYMEISGAERVVAGQDGRERGLV